MYQLTVNPSLSLLHIYVCIINILGTSQTSTFTSDVSNMECKDIIYKPLYTT